MTQRAIQPKSVQREPSTAVADLAGPGFDQTLLLSGGSEAIESALKLARQYAVVTGQKKRWKILARMPGFHGSTLGASAVSGDPDRDEMFGPIMRIMPKLPAPWSYRIPKGYTVDSYADHCADELERQILAEGEETVLAFIVEPVGGVVGALVAPDHYYSKARKICDRYGVGAGRTGIFLAVHHWPDALPDLVVCVKGLSAGYTPLGAMIAPNRVVDKVVDSGGFLHGHTYSGNPLSSAIGIAVLKEMLDHHLMDSAERMGFVLRRKLNALKDRSTTIGTYRGWVSSTQWKSFRTRPPRRFSPALSRRPLAARTLLAISACLSMYAGPRAENWGMLLGSSAAYHHRGRERSHPGASHRDVPDI
ncbi:aminotransferase class III-fold pyridoxal phosphate-dependent enzyme [Mesorhizobium sp. BHbsci]